MPTYTLQGPQGQTVEVVAATEAEAIAKASGQGASPTPGAGPAGRPRPDIGPNARELEDGSIVSTGRNGGLQIIRGATTPRLGADSAPRMYAGMDAAIEASNSMQASEAASRARSGGLAGLWGGPGSGNPLTDDQGALYIDNMDAEDPRPGLATVVGKAVGGDSYQGYLQQGAAFETALMPILSGAAVAPSEAQRMIRAAIPEVGDNPETLARKARQRQQMLNGLAVLAGKPPPFPGVPSMFFKPPEGGTTAAAQPPAARPQSSPPSAPGRMAGFDPELAAEIVAGVGAAPTIPPPSATSGRSQIPPEAAAKLRPGVNTPFRNGQVWTIRDGQPVRLR